MPNLLLAVPICNVSMDVQITNYFDTEKNLKPNDSQMSSGDTSKVSVISKWIYGHFI